MEIKIVIPDVSASEYATKVYNYICKYWKEQGYSPTYREIGKNCGYSMSHTKARTVVKSLEEMGYVRVVAGTTRTIIPLKFDNDEAQKLFPSSAD